MKFTCSQPDLSSHLSFVARAVPSRPSHPVLANILVKASKGQISLTGFDLSLSLQTSFNAEIEEPGAITIPAKMFSDIVNKLPREAEITIEVDDDNIALSTASGQYRLRGIEERDYPQPPIVAQGTPVIFPSDALSSAMKSTIVACSNEETKAILCGVNFKSIPDGVAIAATDGHRLSVVNIQNQSTDLNLTIPTKALKELERLSGDDEIRMYVDRGLVLFEWGSQSIVTRTIDGNYPNYPQLIPQQFEKMVTVNRKELIEVLSRIAVLAEQKNNVVAIALSQAEQSLTLSVDTQDFGSGRESLSAQIVGDLLVAFNVKYLMDGLRSIDSDEVEISLNTPTSPVVLRPINGTDQLYLLMPVQIRN